MLTEEGIKLVKSSKEKQKLRLYGKSKSIEEVAELITELTESLKAEISNEFSQALEDRFSGLGFFL